MRDEFVGILFAVGVILFVYQGYTRLEDYALNLAGILAWGIALFPMAWPSGASHSSFSLHGTCALSFFVCIAYVCIFRASDTLALIHDKAAYQCYRRTYICLGIAMVALPALAFFFISQSPLHTSAIFFVELAGIYVFATYWVVKSHEVSKTDSDKKAAMGKLRVEPHGLSDGLRLRPLSVTSVDDRVQSTEAHQAIEGGIRHSRSMPRILYHACTPNFNVPVTPQVAPRRQAGSVFSFSIFKAPALEP